MTKPIFQGAATALITPMNETGVDYPALGKLINWQIEEGIDALVICGEWVWFTGDRSTTLTLGEDGRFAMSDGISGTYTVTDTAVELLINGTGDPVKLTKEQRDLLRKLDDTMDEDGQPRKKGFFEKLKDTFD